MKMKITVGFLLRLGVFLYPLLLALGQERSYYFSAPHQTQFQPSFRQNQNRFSNSQGFEELNSYLAHPDLDTSDLSPHLRRTLPQYQAGFLENRVNPLKFELTSRTSPSGLQEVSPSTHRPNYSHLFSKTYSHNQHNPQTETFLGQITIQSPAELPKHGGFQPSSSYSYNNINQLTPPVSEAYANFGKYQNDKVPEKMFKFPQVNQIIHLDTPTPEKTIPMPNNTILLGVPRREFLNHRNKIVTPESGSLVKLEVFNSTTGIPITTLDRKHFTFTPLSTTSQPSRTLPNTFNLDSLLEEPLNKSQQPSSNNNVEVIQPVTLPPDQFFTLVHESTPTDFEYENTDTTETTTVLYDVVTIKPAIMVKDDEFSKFIDSREIDATTNSSNNTDLESENLDHEVTSIVTTKSIINNTLVASKTTVKPLVTQQMSPLRSSEQVPSPITRSDGDEVTSTEGWVVVASVQTSRSVSGARYLPFPVVEQHERTKLLNEQVSTLTTNTPQQNSSTESLIDKLDRVQSDLSSDVLTDSFNNDHIAVITESIVETTTSKSSHPPVVIRKFSPHARPSSTTRPKFGFKPKSLDKPQSDQPVTRTTTTPPKSIESLGKIKFKDNTDFLPADYVAQLNTTAKPNNSDVFSAILKKAAATDISSFLPSDYKSTKQPKSNISSKKIKTDDISAFLPLGYKSDDANSTSSDSDNSSMDLVSNLLKKAKQNDIAAFLPPGYASPKPLATSTLKTIESILAKSQTVDITALLPPGYKPPKTSSTTEQPRMVENTTEVVSVYKPRFTPTKSMSTTPETITSKTTGNFKLVFPSRPGSGTTRKVNRLTTPKTLNEEVAAVPGNNLQPTIHKGWPMRATTEFTGWPTPSTTPISIEKLLEAARAASATVSTTTTSTTISTTTVTTTSTTTPRPTTPGWCSSNCDLAGTIKLTSGAIWVPELLDRNTREWQLLANEVQYQLEDVFTKSEMLNKWYKGIRIDGFTEGSVLVDYVVELNNVSQQINTRELKGLFNSALTDVFMKSSSREAKASGLTKDPTTDDKLILGNFVVDPAFTDFVVLPKQILPTVGYAEDNVFLPQWAIAIIVIGLASLLFVIIFGVTVLINKQKNAKKKHPSPLTEDMLNELNKNHMGGFDNYAADDLYNMDEVWNETPYDSKLPKKKAAGSDTSLPNIYDSWKSEWNGYYYNTYYGNHHPSGSQPGYGRRRSDYDTNF